MEIAFTKLGAQLEGAHFDKSKFTAWVYGTGSLVYTYDGTPTTVAANEIGTGNASTLYANAVLSNGEVTLSNPHSFSSYPNGWYFDDTPRLNHVNRSIEGYPALDFYYSGKFYKPGWRTKLGWAFSENATKYPSVISEGPATDGYYYEKITLA